MSSLWSCLPSNSTRRSQGYNVTREKNEQGRWSHSEVRHRTKPQVQGPHFCFHPQGTKAPSWRYAFTRPSGPQRSWAPGQCCGGDASDDVRPAPQFRSSFAVWSPANQLDTPLPHLPLALSHIDGENSGCGAANRASWGRSAVTTHSPAPPMGYCICLQVPACRLRVDWVHTAASAFGDCLILWACSPK